MLDYGKHAFRVAEFAGINNVRDLGGIAISDDRIVTPGLIIRGSDLHNATLEDTDKLLNELNIHAVLDVRCGWELEKRADVKIDGVEYKHIPFYDKDIVGIDYTEPGQEGKVFSRDVPCTPSLFYASLTNPLTTAQIASALSFVFDHAVRGQAVYMHCNNGKDRIGMLTLLILTILGCSEDDILEDYLLTNVWRDSNYQSMLEHFRKFCQNDDEAHELVMSHRALPEYAIAFIDAIEKDCGGMDVYIEKHLGFTQDRISDIRSKCTKLARFTH